MVLISTEIPDFLVRAARNTGDMETMGLIKNSEMKISSN